MLIKMNYIANNNEINEALKNFYNRKCTALEIADVYFKYKLYSAASSFYNIELFDILNTYEFERKSYCFQKMGECYLNQQSDQAFSNWQLQMIYELFTESLTYDQDNFRSMIGLGKCYMLQNKMKEAYHTYNHLLLSLYKYTDMTPEEYDIIFDICFTLYDLAEQHFIIKYDYFNNAIVNFFTSINYDSNKIYQLMERIKQHKDSITQYESNIIKGNIYG